jgi:predicted O-methyltransferase YrrM
MGKDYVFEGNEKLRIDYGNLTLENLKERLKVFHNKGIIRQGLSEDIVSEFKDESLDFIYIDGDHTYEGCKKDVELWWPKLRVGGLFSGHDYKNRPRNNKEAKRAVDEYFDKLGITVNKTMGERCPSFWWIKE